MANGAMKDSAVFQIAEAKRRMNEPASPVERDAVTQLRELVPTSSGEPSLSDAYYLRFLRARGGSVPRACELLRKHLEWRREHRPAYIERERVDVLLNSGVCRLTGVTREGTAVMWFRAELWEPSKHGAHEWLQGIVFFIERTITAANQLVVLLDMSGWTLSHTMHLSQLLDIVALLQNHYPERLLAALVLRAPALVDAAWVLLRPWVDPVTAAKIVFVPKADEAWRVSHVVEPELVPDALGGGWLPAGSLPCPNLPGDANFVALPPAALIAGARTGGRVGGVGHESYAPSGGGDGTAGSSGMGSVIAAGGANTSMMGGME